MSYSAQTCGALRYQEVLDHVEERRRELSKHQFFAFLADESVAPERRMHFAPYWTYFAVQAADIMDYWVRYEHPKNELEELVNEFIREDDFHYNLLLHDVRALGFTIERYGSFDAVVRHLWSHETHATRQFFYHWAAVTVMYRDDPMVTMTVFETGEAGLRDLLGTAYKSIYGEGGLTELKYFGREHIELEMSHNVTSWFEEESPEKEVAEEEEEKEEEEEEEEGKEEEGEEEVEGDFLAGIEITEEQMKLYIEIADGILDRFIAIYDELHDLEVAEDSIFPEKFKVEGYPPLDQFPVRSMTSSSKDEL